MFLVLYKSKLTDIKLVDSKKVNRVRCYKETSRILSPPISPYTSDDEQDHIEMSTYNKVKNNALVMESIENINKEDILEITDKSVQPHKETIESNNSKNSDMSMSTGAYITTPIKATKQPNKKKTRIGRKKNKKSRNHSKLFELTEVLKR